MHSISVKREIFDRKTSHFRYFLALLCLLFGFASNIQAQNKSYNFSGVVKDISTGEVLPGAIVYIHETGKNSTCDNTGHFVLNQLSAGVYHIHVQLISYEPFAQNFTVQSDTSVIIQLEPTSIELKNFTVESDLLKTEHVKNSQDVESANRDFLNKNAGNTFANTLEKIPGLRSMNVGVGIAKPVIRGMSFNRVVVTENGIKQEGQQWGSDHGLELDQFNVERIEIIKGPSSLLYGSDAMAGVINILPPVIPIEGNVNAEFLGFYRSNNENYGGSILTEFNKKRNFLRLRATWQEFGDYKIPADTFVYNSYRLPIYNQRLKNTAGKELDFSLSTGVMRDWGSLRLTATLFGQEAGLFPGAIGIPRAYNLQHDGDYRNVDLPKQVNEHLKVLLNLNVKLKKGWWENDFGFQKNERMEKSVPHAHGTAPISSSDTALFLELSTWSFNSRIHRYYNPRFKTIFGFSGQLMNNEKKGFEFLIPDYQSYSVGAYFFNQYSIRENLTLSSGIRSDYGAIDLAGFDLPIYDFSQTIIGYQHRSPKMKRDFFNWSFAAGLSWELKHELNIKTNFGRSFRFPVAVELAGNGIHHGTFRHEMGDSTLNPEIGYQFDLAISQHGKKYLIKLTPYFNYFENYIFLRPAAEFSTLPDAGQIYRYTQASAIHTGAELFAETHIIENVHLEFSAEYIYNLNLDTYLPLPFTPPGSLFGGIEYEKEGKENKKMESWFVGAEFKYFFSQNRTDRNELATPGYGLLSAQLGINFKFKHSGIKLILRGNNLLNLDYYNHISRYRILNLPEQGRNFSVILRIPLRFGKS